MIKIKNQICTYNMNPEERTRTRHFMVDCAQANNIAIQFNWGGGELFTHEVILEGEVKDLECWLRDCMGMDRPGYAIDNEDWSLGYAGRRPLGRYLT